MSGVDVQRLPNKPRRPAQALTPAQSRVAPTVGPTLDQLRRARLEREAQSRRRAADDVAWAQLAEAQDAASRRWAAEQEAALLAPPVEDALDLDDADAADEYVDLDDPPAPDIAQRLEGLSREQLLALVGSSHLDGVGQDDASLRRDLISWVDEGGEAGRGEAIALLEQDIADLPTEPETEDEGID